MGRTEYLNTDLELTAAFDLHPLVAALGTPDDVHVMGVFQREDGSWQACLECWPHHDTAELTIRELLSLIERLSPEGRAMWDACASRVFDIGCECGEEPREHREEISPESLERIVKLGAGMRLTLYGCPASAG